MKKLCQFISKYMGVLVFAAAVLAFVFPDAADWVWDMS